MSPRHSGYTAHTGPVTPVQHDYLSGELKQNGLWLEPCKQTEIVLENVENRKGKEGLIWICCIFENLKYQEI